MGADLKEYDIDVRRFADSMEIGIGQAARKIGFQLFREVVNRTPVDTGRARAGWNLSEGAPDNTVPDKGGPYGPPAPKAIPPKRFPRIWLTNFVPYIVFLDTGSSQQAPDGIVLPSLIGLERKIRTLYRASRR